MPVPLQTEATEPILRKRKTAGETAETAEGEPPPKCHADGFNHKDTELMPRQCHCGKVFDTTNNLKRHITVIHKNDNWSCSGSGNMMMAQWNHTHRYVVIILLCGSTSVPYTRAGIYIIVT